MISIDREMLWQWDRGQRVQLHDVLVGTKVHFSNAAIKPNALVREAYEDGEGMYADIPDILLQTAGTLTAYIYLEDGDEGHTEYRKMFIVRDRERPDDYVYTEDDVKTWVSLEERIKVLEESGGGAAGGLIRPLSTIGEIDGVKVEHVPDKDRVDLTVEMTAESMDSVFGGNAVYKNDFLNARQLQLMFRIPGAGRLFLWELFEDDLITVTNYPNKKFIMVSTNRMIVSLTYDENGQFVSENKTYQASVQQLDEAKATVPNSATVNEANELVMQRTDGDAVSELFKVRLPERGGTGGGESGGGEKSWRKVAEIKTTEDLTYISVSEDMDGNPLSFDEAIAVVCAARASGATNGNYVIAATPQWYSSFNGYGAYGCPLNADVYLVTAKFTLLPFEYLRTELSIGKMIAPNLASFPGFSLSSNVPFANVQYNYGLAPWSISPLSGKFGSQVGIDILDENRKLKGITIGTDSATSVKIGAGSTLEVWVR